jgi:cell division protein ZapA
VNERIDCDDNIGEVPVTHVTVSINGRQFRMACEDGQEAHLVKLAGELDERIAGLRMQFGEIGDARLTVMAALMIADELSEAARQLANVKHELAALRDTRVIDADRDLATQAAAVAAFHSAAERIEEIAKKLNRATGDGESVAMG